MKSETRELIVNTASRLFYEKGYNLTGINEIIKEAGIAKATLYGHFRSKEELCLAYLDKLDHDTIDKLRNYISKKPKGNTRLLAILEFLLPFFHKKDFNGCWSIRTMAEIPKDNKAIREKIYLNKHKLIDLISDLVHENKQDLSKDEVVILARRIYLLYEGALTESHIQMDDWPIHESIEILKSIL